MSAISKHCVEWRYVYLVSSDMHADWPSPGHYLPRRYTLPCRCCRFSVILAGIRQGWLLFLVLFWVRLPSGLLRYQVTVGTGVPSNLHSNTTFCPSNKVWLFIVPTIFICSVNNITGNWNLCPDFFFIFHIAEWEKIHTSLPQFWTDYTCLHRYWMKVPRKNQSGSTTRKLYWNECCSVKWDNNQSYI